MTKLSRRMEHRINTLPGAFKKLGNRFADLIDEDFGDDPIKTLLHGFSQHERRSLKTVLDDILGPDYSDEDIDLLWSKVPSHDFIMGVHPISNLRAFFQAIRRELA